MIHGISKHSGAKDNSAAKAIEYFLSENFYDAKIKIWRKREPVAELISGDREVIERLCAECDFKNRYTSGVLSFSEEESKFLKETPETIGQLLKDWEDFAFAGVKDDCRVSLIVKHQHKNRLEFHYIIPRINIESGKYFNPFPPNYNGKRGKGANSEFIKHNDAFTDFICKKYELQNPRAPGVTRSIKISPHDTQKDIKQKLHSQLIKAIGAGIINSRKEVISILKECGFEVTRAGADYISVKAPGTQKAMRLTGGIYEDRKSFEHLRTELVLTEDSRSFEKITQDYDSVLQKRTSEVKNRHRIKGAAALRTEKFEQHSAKEISDTAELLKNLRSNLPLFNTIYDNTVDFLNNNQEILNMGNSGTRLPIASNISKFTNAQQKAVLGGLLSNSEYEGGEDKIKELIENSAKLIELLIKLLLSLLTCENHLDGYSLSGSQYSIAATDLLRLQQTLNTGKFSENRITETEEKDNKFGFALKTKINYEAKSDEANIPDRTQKSTEKVSFDCPSAFK
ncbi:relaxase/mobilization nuclease domain-containing protein [Pseudomonas baetica]|uniref:relaxase/mobilization nuclease domain-containing protein n=1 Tax=Pseudomonas baetica TaxID=674054 RepID=UPI002404EBEB|nr:relaxase/mobilization nuclease domain-containing protein [Pseudomonas baetica]MDF9776267.1 hypothetical protein [Pseudomonas baetica]